MNLNTISRLLYRGGARSRDARAVEQAIRQGSLWPIIRRFLNRWIGRNIVSRLWIK